MTDPAEIARGLSKRERAEKWYGIGCRRLPKTVFSLSEKGLVLILPAAGGWCWRPTGLGLAVRAILKGTDHA